MPVKRRILIVDDEEPARYALARAFRGNYETVEADNLATAQALARTEAFDVILLDQNMPGGNGMNFFIDYQPGPDSPAVIVITAHGSERL